MCTPDGICYDEETQQSIDGLTDQNPNATCEIDGERDHEQGRASPEEARIEAAAKKAKISKMLTAENREEGETEEINIIQKYVGKFAEMSVEGSLIKNNPEKYEEIVGKPLPPSFDEMVAYVYEHGTPEQKADLVAAGVSFAPFIGDAAAAGYSTGTLIREPSGENAFYAGLDVVGAVTPLPAGGTWKRVEEVYATAKAVQEAKAAEKLVETTAKGADDFVDWYHGSLDAPKLRAEKFGTVNKYGDAVEPPFVCVTTDCKAAQNAISPTARYDAQFADPANLGIIEGRMTKSEWDALHQSGDLRTNYYQGFDHSLKSSETKAMTQQGVDALNRSMKK